MKKTKEKRSLTLEVLIATMHQNDFSLLDRMQVETDAVVINQCDRYAYHELQRGNHIVRWFDVSERGLSRSRNMALSKTRADICLLADDDEILKKNYEQRILEEFERNREADLVTFNLTSIGDKSSRYINKKRRRLHFYNIMRYGSARIAFKRDKVVKARLAFAPNFGAGAEIACGEDSLFLQDCLHGGLKAFSSPTYIADIDDGDGNSSWFKGYTEKYFRDLGAVYAAMSPRFSTLWMLQYVIRHKKATQALGRKKCLAFMKQGRRNYRSLQ